MQTQLVRYTEYNIWANRHHTDIISTLTEEQIDKVQVSSFPSIRKTLYHIWDAQGIWTIRLKGETVLDWPSKNFKGTTKEAIENFLNSSREFATLVKGFDEGIFHNSIQYKKMEGKEFINSMADIVMHVMNHSTFHRGQLISMFREVGITKIPSTDFIAYCRL
jgi:uncharacterized damage-inducible protein DinB